MPETEFYCIIITILLPVSIDDSPSRLRTDKLGERSVVLRTDHATAVKTVREVASGVGFSIPTEFFPADRIAKERDTDITPYTALGLGLPAAAEHVLDVGDPRVGALLHCRVVLREIEPDRQEFYHLDTMRLAQEVGLAPDDERWAALVAQVERMVDDTFTRLGRKETTERRSKDC